MKKNNGITLIALIITIIVMLILVAVTITTAVNGGLFNYARKAGVDTNTRAAEEQEYANLQAGMTTNDLIDFYTTWGAEKWTHTDTDGDGVLDVGEVVTKGTESFYVIKTPTQGETKVKLLAMYNLKKENDEITLKQDTTGENNACAFSSTNYWSDETNYPLDLNSYPIPEGETSIITIAKKYGESLGGTGRLMRLEEIEALGEDSDEYSTSGYPAWVNSQNFWLGSAYNSDEVWAVLGENSGLVDDDYDHIGYFGVRPVVEVPISLINK